MSHLSHLVLWNPPLLPQLLPNPRLRLFHRACSLSYVVTPLTRRATAALWPSVQPLSLHPQGPQDLGNFFYLESRQTIKISSHCCRFLCRMLHVCKGAHCKAVCPSPHSGLILPSDISKLLPCSFTALLNKVPISVACKNSVGYILRRKKQALCGGNFPNSSGHFYHLTVLTPNGVSDL